MTVSKLEKPDWRLFFDHLSKIPEIRKHPPETGPKTGLKTASTLSAVEPVPAAAMIALPWTAPSFAAMKGIIHEPSTKPTMKPESRDALLTAVAKARGWIDDIRLGRIASLVGWARSPIEMDTIPSRARFPTDTMRTSLHKKSNQSPPCRNGNWKNSEQRPEPETRPARAEMPEIADQRLGHPSLTCG